MAKAILVIDINDDIKKYSIDVFKRNEDDDIIELRLFKNHERKIWKIHELGDTTSSAHGGSDLRLVEEMYDIITKNLEPKTSLEISVESHLIALSSEESRLQNGATIDIKH